MYKPKFSYTGSLVDSITKIERVIGIFDFVDFNEEEIQPHTQEASHLRILGGAMLDGSSLTRTEILAICKGTGFFQPSTDVLQIRNLVQLEKHLAEIVLQKQTITVEAIKELHVIVTNSIVPISKAGVFRQNNIVIKDEETTGVIYTPPQPVQIPVLMEQFCLFLETESNNLHPSILAAISYYIFNAIHPFVEGNDSVSRAIIYWILGLRGANLSSILSFESTFDENLDSLLEIFFDIHRQDLRLGEHDLTSWIEVFVSLLASSYEEAKIRLGDILTPKMKLPVKVPDQVPLSMRQMKIIEYIKDNGRVVMRQLREFFPGLSEDSILRDLQILTKKDIIEKEGSTKSASYILKQ